MPLFWEHHLWPGKMKIGFDAKRLYNNFTGLGNYSRTAIDILTESFPENEYLLYTPKIKENHVTSPYLDRKGCRTILPKSVIRGSLWRTFRLASETKKDGVDLFHGLSNELPVGLDIPSVVTIHDVAFRTFPDMYHRTDIMTYNLKWRYACRNADRIIAISESTKQDIIRFYDVDPAKISVVYQPVNKIFYSQKECGSPPQELAEQIGEQPFMLYVGSINSRKNLLGAVRALELLPGELRIPLVIVGDGREYKQKVMSYIAKQRLEDMTIFMPGKTIYELKYLYRNARLLVYPSFYEGFGLPVVEALLSGCPVVTSNLSSLPEAAGPASMLADPNNPEEISDKMRMILSDETFRTKIAYEGLRYAAKRFNPQRLAKELMEVYRHTLT